MLCMSFETLSFLSHLVHWKAYAIIFWQMWKDILGFELRSPRIVCTKLIPSAKHFYNQLNRDLWSNVHKWLHIDPTEHSKHLENTPNGEHSYWTLQDLNSRHVFLSFIHPTIIPQLPPLYFRSSIYDNMMNKFSLQIRTAKKPMATLINQMTLT